MAWVKALHLIFMVTWFAGLFYLPRLFVYHADCGDAPGRERFKVMEHKLFFVITTPGAVLTILFGLWLLIDYGWSSWSRSGWLHTKLLLVTILAGYHLLLGRWLFAFKRDDPPHGSRFFRIANEFPTLILFAVVILTVVKPF